MGGGGGGRCIEYQHREGGGTKRVSTCRKGWVGDRDRVSTWRDKASMDIERGQTESIDIEGGTEYRHRGWDRDR